MLVELTLLTLGCGLLYFGGDWLVDGVTGLAAHLRVPPVIVAFVVMGFGTSAPELFVAVNAMLVPSPDIAMGNVVGSNIANLLLVLAVAALITPLNVDRRVLHIDGAAMLAAAIALCFVALDGTVSRLDAILLVVAMAAYLILRWRTLPDQDEPDELATESLRGPVIMSICALVALPFGAHLFIDGAIGIANRFGVSEALIGLTVVALGTSLPELASCIAAALRRNANIILGGILGSNVFNSTIVLGGAAIVAPITVTESILGFWLPMMIAASLSTIAFLRTDLLLSRKEASVMLASYLAIFIV
ncbi:calcium/sodium antiporter [Yoonia sp. F2084L]|uniref:calcium/sodium antiporter n=1 Tax=Yoonia sp. F2084L TaxID=2926419 RepID=UPI001FF4851A|nr:calcium/sodium antiporter [Yoonia sp. F2084L]MCK0097448.1 calcium/sodium antiporter [Yoonia sp. F2084L]